MEQFVQIFNLITGVAIVAMQVFAVCVFISWLFRKAQLAEWVNRYKQQLLTIISATALAGSLTYSYVIGFAACYLCWTQRLLLVPVLIIAATGVIQKKATKTIVKWSAPFVGVGTIVAIYHTLIQNGIGTENALCQAIGGVSCTQLYVNEFGFITIPVMSLTVYVLLLVILLTRKPKQ